MAVDEKPARESDDKPSLRQRLHAATGDRDAEAEAVADRAADEGDDEVTEHDAKVAVQRARGERGIDAGEPEPDHELVTVDDAEAVAEERTDS
jgi:hypothetical protein